MGGSLIKPCSQRITNLVSVKPICSAIAKRRVEGFMEESSNVESAFISVGCNRVVGAVSWGASNLVAFGAHHNVAIFSPDDGRILVTLPGHKDFVNCVLWLPSSSPHFLVSACADGAINLWAYLGGDPKWRLAAQLPKAHDRAVTCLAAILVTPSLALLASTSSDCSVRVWSVSLPECDVSLLQSISLGSRAMVAASMTALPGRQETILLALGGLDNHVHFYAGLETGEFRLLCQVTGHQDWVRSLDFSLPFNGEVFLASASQDKTIRIWKICIRSTPESSVGVSLKSFIDGPIFKVGKDAWQVSLESLLLGHEDWVYSVRWKPRRVELGTREGNSEDMDPWWLLSASMDRTMMIWRPDSSSGIWMNEVTVGELAQSALGFYGGVWSPHGDAILAHGYSGSFHMWKNFDLQGGEWKPQLVPSGHSAAVVDLAWAKTGQFFLSVSHDQTARLFACWNWNREYQQSRRNISWHEVGRPQVHGHDLSCLAIVKGPGNHLCVSGADEKVARVFEAPGTLLDTLLFTTGGKEDGEFHREDVQVLGANMSALGLSQKPIYAEGRGSVGSKDTGMAGLDTMDALPDAVPTVLTEPPLEEHLAQNTLWPELHKMYGHGNELFAMCCDHAGKFIATACKAQSATFAQVWLWYVGSWRPAGQLKSHLLTVTQLEFSHNDKFLLSVSRDRHLSVFGRNCDCIAENGNLSPPYKLLTRIDAHRRIIWTCSWSHCDRFFATGSRDKIIKIWGVIDGNGGVEVLNIHTLPTFKSGVTALAWGPSLLLAVGLEDGALELWKGCAQESTENGSQSSPSSVSAPEKLLRMSMFCLEIFDRYICHVATVHRVAWRDVDSVGRSGLAQDGQEAGEPLYRDSSLSEVLQLVSCSADYSIRLFNVKLQQNGSK